MFGGLSRKPKEPEGPPPEDHSDCSPGGCWRAFAFCMTLRHLTGRMTGRGVVEPRDLGVVERLRQRALRAQWDCPARKGKTARPALPESG